MSNANTITNKKWSTLCALMLAGGTIYKLGALKNAFYVPMQELMGLTHTQIGLTMSVAGFVSTISFFVAIYITDRFSKKILISVALKCAGLLGVWMSTFPSFPIFIFICCLLAICADMLFWPTMLKTVRLLGTTEEQGRLFGILEAGRGLIDTLVSFAALWIFAALGEGLLGLKAAILFFAAVCFSLGVILFFILDADKIRETNQDGEYIGKNRAAWEGVIRALKNRRIWMVSLNIFCVYAMFCGITYFIPFLNEIYHLPVMLVSSYGIINQYGLKLIGGPTGGFLTDKVFHSPTRFMRCAFLTASAILLVFIILPHDKMSVYAGMTVAMMISTCIFCLRAVFFAPMDEIHVHPEITGAAMSLASFVGLLPGSFMFSVYGGILDRIEGLSGYRVVFIVFMGFAISGIIISTLILREIYPKKAKK